jgi:nitronate monooxygenase
MGVGVSSWTLAREVSSLGQLGVVSGTALDTVLVRRLALGDPGGHMRRAIAEFPFRAFAQRTVQRYFRPADSMRGDTGTDAVDAGGTLQSPEAASAEKERAGRRFPYLALPRVSVARERAMLMMLANFVEVRLAKSDHGGVVGINYLHKIQLPLLPSLYGALLAGVDAVLVGAGIPGDIPRAIGRLIEHKEARIMLDVVGGEGERHELAFDPQPIWSEEPSDGNPPTLKRPRFLAIVSSVTLGRALLKKAPGGIDGLVIERPTAGGHNAPPRGPLRLTREGEPLYGDRDEVDLADLAILGVPFWLAGGYATREGYRAALAEGAHGVQIGTAFAFCNESGLDPELRRTVLEGVLRNDVRIFTDPAASPTGFPFKVVQVSGTVSDAQVYESRPRICDLGYLRRAYRKQDGSIGYRCPAEPVEDYVRKGGKREDTVGRKCLCNALVTNIGLGQRHPSGYEEPALLTAGDDMECLRQFITAGRLSYTARDVIDATL